MDAKLYGMAHSHPSIAARRMLEHKGIPHRVRNILPGLHPIVVRLALFRKRTVPALRIDGKRIQGTLNISRYLDEIEPSYPLFPADPQKRRLVEEAERFGHDELQPLGRRVFRWAALRSNAVRAWMAREVVGMPAPTFMGWLYKPIIVYFASIENADDATVRADLQRLPELLDRADSLLEKGVVGGAEANAADYQILSSIRLLSAQEDLRPIVEKWRCANAAYALISDYPGPVPAAFPSDWLPSGSRYI